MTPMPTSPPKLEPIGLVGLGLMGQGIATSLLAHGLQVVAYNRTATRERSARQRIGEMLQELREEGFAPEQHVLDWERRFTFRKSIKGLAACPFIIETVAENLTLKRKIYDDLEACVSPHTIIASNTSSFPASLIQEGRQRPGRFLVMHWAEPAAITRYLEVVPGKATTTRAIRLTQQLGKRCEKEPTVLQVDLHGFISNRLMYAMMREACHLLELGVADVATIDQSFRNDIGWWATLAGPFRWMDLTGLPAYAAVMHGLYPHLSAAQQPSQLITKLVASGAQGIANGTGWYQYSPAMAQQWEHSWRDFTFDIRRIVEKYERQLSQKKAK